MHQIFNFLIHTEWIITLVPIQPLVPETSSSEVICLLLMEHLVTQVW